MGKCAYLYIFSVLYVKNPLYYKGIQKNYAKENPLKRGGDIIRSFRFLPDTGDAVSGLLSVLYFLCWHRRW